MRTDKKEKVFEVKEKTSLLHFLFEKLPDSSRSKLKRLLSGGCVFVDDVKTTQFDHALNPGARVQIKAHDHSFKSPYLQIVYEDRWIVVIDKKEGVLSMGTNQRSFCVKTILDDYFLHRKERCKAHVVHRLDRETSGLMVYAKDKRTEMLFEENWHEIVYDRKYIAVLQGSPTQDEGTVKSWLKENNAFYVYSTSRPDEGKLAITHYKILRKANNFSLVEMKLETGRKNQIRVHMHDLGCPVVGDAKYGSTVNPIKRLALHAYRLNFYHPVTHQKMEFETAIPHSFQRLV